MKNTTLVASLAGMALLAACGPNTEPVGDLGTSSSASAPASTTAQPANVGAQAVAVSRVIDGDTFVVTGNVKVRVLGIDSCEHDTPGGPRATAEAHQLLDGQSVTLTEQPGHDKDRYGRELRYVKLADGRDYGSVMVTADHTAVYAKTNDASAAYVAHLRTLDGNGRTCGATQETTSTAPAADVHLPNPDLPNHLAHLRHHHLF